DTGRVARPFRAARSASGSARTAPPAARKSSASGSHWTLRWREMDSNFGPPSEGQRFRGSQSELPGRLVMPTRGQQSIGPQLGRASWAGARRSRFLLKANCGGSNAGRKKLFLYGFESTWVRIHGAALLNPEFSPDAEGARPQRSA